MTSFNAVAAKYDLDFTNSNIGIGQRERVWEYLNNNLNHNQKLNILELNCGTGEDAIRFAEHGHFVVATDSSAEMLKIAAAKIKKLGLQKKVQTLNCDLKEMTSCNFNRKFDLIFSNFGGLNCLNPDEILKLSCDVLNLLKPNGRIITVIMPNFCLWESLYFISKFDFKKAFRRNTKSSLEVRIGNSSQKTWYYSPSTFAKIIKLNYIANAIKPIGIAIPPSYMEKSIGKKIKLMKFLCWLEKLMSPFPRISKFSDHFLIDLHKR